MTFKQRIDPYFVSFQPIWVAFGANYVQMVEYRPILSATEM